jgi:outer membrane protein assembly factor BamC
MTHRAAAVALALLAAGCSTMEDMREGNSQIEYKSATKLPPLDVPPDLTSPNGDGRYQMPDAAGGTATLSTYEKGRAQQAREGNRGPRTVLPTVNGVRVERDGDQRWLVVDMPAEKVWPVVKTFWQENGLLIAQEYPEAGILETNWAENRAPIKDSWVNSKIGTIFRPLASTGTRDMYRTRLERTADGGTEVYISHRGVVEVYTSGDNTETAWQPRPPDPGLEVEFLRRLMVQLGTPADQARREIADAAPPKSRASLTKNVNGIEMLEVYEPFDRAWRRVGLALDRVGFTVEDRDRQKGVYFVRYADPQGQMKEKGLLDKLAFWRDNKPQVKPEQYRVSVTGAAQASQVQVLDHNGTAENSPTANRILALLHEQLK